MLVLTVKALHILGALLFLGAGMMTAWYKVRADRSGDPAVVVWCQREIVRADWLFTLPSAIVLPASGLYLVHAYGMPWTTGWVLLGIGAFALSGLLWLPAVWLQIRMRRLAEEALASGTLPAEFHRLNRIWMALGVPAFVIAVATVWLMTVKWSPF